VSDESSDDELREAARGAIEAGMLPMPEGRWGVEPQPFLTLAPKNPIRCAICGRYMYAGDQPLKLTDFPGAPEMHYPRCFKAWHDAAREAWDRAFDKEDFHIGDQRTGEGCLIWASLPPDTRVRFFVNRPILIKVLGCPSALAGETALARCRELRPSIEDACRRAFYERPGKQVELQASDFQ
jgi:hypothetical protein